MAPGRSTGAAFGHRATLPWHRRRVVRLIPAEECQRRRRLFMPVPMRRSPLQQGRSRWCAADVVRASRHARRGHECKRDLRPLSPRAVARTRHREHESERRRRVALGRRLRAYTSTRIRVTSQAIPSCRATCWTRTAVFARVDRPCRNPSRCRACTEFGRPHHLNARPRIDRCSHGNAPPQDAWPKVSGSPNSASRCGAERRLRSGLRQIVTSGPQLALASPSRPQAVATGPL